MVLFSLSIDVNLPAVVVRLHECYMTVLFNAGLVTVEISPQPASQPSFHLPYNGVIGDIVSEVS